MGSQRVEHSLILCREGKTSATCSLFLLAAWGPLALLRVTLSLLLGRINKVLLELKKKKLHNNVTVLNATELYT